MSTILLPNPQVEASQQKVQVLRGSASATAVVIDGGDATVIQFQFTTVGQEEGNDGRRRPSPYR